MLYWDIQLLHYLQWPHLVMCNVFCFTEMLKLSFTACSSIYLSLCRIRSTILDVIYSHRLYWECFQVQETWPLTGQENEDLGLSPSACHIPRTIFLGPTSPPPTSYETRNCYPVQSSVFLMSVASRLNNLVSSRY